LATNGLAVPAGACAIPMATLSGLGFQRAASRPRCSGAGSVGCRAVTVRHGCRGLGVPERARLAPGRGVSSLSLPVRLRAY